ncbi:NAD(P)/FAD-dependent oxidoreductase [Prolixibacteraceae bacterium Z1-6]|uniref:NAD(P)/FAD-dependent oxidoreductase n=1 Tax=Draconibacterium aestuarii TaxID=2998507 RepID=A0A9X3FBH4_9BACT|nr:NAD(P)/FAD-dependent oxidoreductase [Prolixibacteraceae bacterium Z1-6]
MKYDTIVVGGGIAGLTAAAFVAKAGQKVMLFEKQSKVGGLIQTFERNGVYFDGGLRSMENSGTLFPMLRSLGIEIDFIQSKTSIGVGNSVMVLENHESIEEYQAFLIKEFPENENDIKNIINEVRKSMDYMDVLYGIDNPTFMDLKNDKEYVRKELLPWLFKFLMAIRKINKLKEPVDEYLQRFTKNQALIDLIGQHFFQKTPASFALSYFSLYLDYYYPKGGTATVIYGLADYIKDKGGVIRTSTNIEQHNPEQKFVIDDEGNRFDYEHLIWAADLNQLYKRIPTDTLKSKKLVRKIKDKINYYKGLRGGDSVFSVYTTVDLEPEYFAEKCTGHFFYTPREKGLSAVDKIGLNEFMGKQTVDQNDTELKEKLISYLKEYCDLNTLEIAIPALRDPAMAPKGKTGVVVSLLYDYCLAKKIDDAGWTAEIKKILEAQLIKIMDESIYPGFKEKVSHRFSSSPLTIEKLTDSTEGGITGWAFTNPYMPVVNKMLTVAKSVNTVLPHVYQAGQWAYSPSGMPISVLTGKLAADKVIKNSKKKGG